jgi:hypothetical protein
MRVRYSYLSLEPNVFGIFLIELDAAWHHLQISDTWPQLRSARKHVAFMHKVGRLKHLLTSWKDMFFAEAHDLKGSQPR